MMAGSGRQSVFRPRKPAPTTTGLGSLTFRFSKMVRGYGWYKWTKVLRVYLIGLHGFQLAAVWWLDRL